MHPENPNCVENIGGTLKILRITCHCTAIYFGVSVFRFSATRLALLLCLWRGFEYVYGKRPPRAPQGGKPQPLHRARLKRGTNGQRKTGCRLQQAIALEKRPCKKIPNGRKNAWFGWRTKWQQRYKGIAKIWIWTSTRTQLLLNCPCLILTLTEQMSCKIKSEKNPCIFKNSNQR